MDVPAPTSAKSAMAIVNLFRVLDTDGNGELSREEVRAALDTRAGPVGRARGAGEEGT